MEGLRLHKNKIKFEPSYYIVTLLAILTGYFNQYIVFAISILLHECGHLLMASFFKWELDELKFFAFGGQMRFKGELNKANKEDLLISSAGVMVNLMLLSIFLYFAQLEVSGIQLKWINSFIWAQCFIIVFNLIPLPPLDGSRILGDILSCFFPYRYSLRIICYFNIVFISFIVLLTILYDFRQFYLILGFLFYSTVKFNQNAQYLFQLFLLHKKMYRNVDLPIKITILCDDSWEDKIYRGYLNMFQFNERFHDELTWLQLKFRENNKVIIDVKIKSD